MALFGPSDRLAQVATCRNCRHFVARTPKTLADLPQDLPSDRGQCRQASPRVGYWENRWPIVREDEGCGQFKLRESPDGVQDHHG